MKHVSIFAIVGLMIATLYFSAAFAQDSKQGTKNAPPQNQQNNNKQGQNRQGDQNRQKPPVRPPINRNPVRPPVNPPTPQRPNPVRKPPSQKPPVQPPSNQPPNRRPQNPPVQPPANRNPGRPTPGQGNFRPRPGQIVIPPNRHWVPNVGHRFNTSIYVSIDIWAPASFGYGTQSYNWNPSAWNYSVEDSLMDLVYVSERTSNTFRDSFERQMTQRGLRSSPGGQTTWDRVQRMDESFERLRAETGSVFEEELQAAALESLALAQQVANSFHRYPELLQLVQYEWDDCLFEFNELARYYDEPGIR